MLNDLFYESSFIIKFILRNNIKFILLTNTYTIRYGFINDKFAEKVCQVFEIKL